MGSSLGDGISGDAVAVHVEGDEGASDEGRVHPFSPLLHRESHVSGVREREARERRRGGECDGLLK